MDICSTKNKEEPKTRIKISMERITFRRRARIRRMLARKLWYPSQSMKDFLVVFINFRNLSSPHPNQIRSPNRRVQPSFHQCFSRIDRLFRLITKSVKSTSYSECMKIPSKSDHTSQQIEATTLI